MKYLNQISTNILVGCELFDEISKPNKHKYISSNKRGSYILKLKYNIESLNQFIELKKGWTHCKPFQNQNSNMQIVIKTCLKLNRGHFHESLIIGIRTLWGACSIVPDTIRLLETIANEHNT
jgi:hypothetical protein